MKTVVVVLSGGQDSATCLYWAKKEYPAHEARISAVNFDYGQKHKRERWSAGEIASDAGVLIHYIDVAPLRGKSPLIGGSELGKYNSPSELPGGVEPTFIPGRNLLFLTYAANLAHSLVPEGEVPDIALVTGVCEADFGGYFDCRLDFIHNAEDTLNEGFYGGEPDVGHLVIETPLMYLTKKETVELAIELGCLPVMAKTHTCYNGTEIPCRQCHACMIRERGFLEAGVPDPLVLKHGLDWPPLWNLQRNDI